MIMTDVASEDAEFNRVCSEVARCLRWQRNVSLSLEKLRVNPFDVTAQDGLLALLQSPDRFRVNLSVQTRHAQSASRVGGERR